MADDLLIKQATGGGTTTVRALDIGGKSHPAAVLFDASGNAYTANSITQNVTASAGNSSTANLASLATFTGTSVSTLGVNAIQVSLKADQDCTVWVDQSPDGTNWDLTDSFNYWSGVGNFGITIQAVSSYCRVRVKNIGGSTTTVLRLQTALCPTANPLPRSLNPDGLLEMAPITFDAAHLSAFGTLEAVPTTPVVQIDFEYGINTQTGTGAASGTGATATTNAGRLALTCGTASNGTASFTSRRIAKYRPGQGMVAKFTPVFGSALANLTQIQGPGNTTDGYFFGYNGTAFGILHRNAGVDTWTAQTSWNGDQCLGAGASGFTWTPTFGNVCMIKYPYLGYGDIFFFVQNPVDGRFILCHTIRYANTTASTQLSNPNLFFYAQILNSGNTTTRTMHTGSVGIFMSGVRSFIGSPKRATDSQKTGVTTETCLINLRNCTTYNTVANRGLLRLTSISAAAFGSNSVVTVRLKIGATIGGAPSYVTIDGTTGDSGVTITSGNSVSSVDKVGTTVTGGTYIWNLNVGMGTNSGGQTQVDLTTMEIFVAPGETLTVSAAAGASSTIAVSLNWNEEI